MINNRFFITVYQSFPTLLKSYNFIIGHFQNSTIFSFIPIYVWNIIYQNTRSFVTDHSARVPRLDERLPGWADVQVPKSPCQVGRRRKTGHQVWPRVLQPQQRMKPSSRKRHKLCSESGMIDFEFSYWCRRKMDDRHRCGSRKFL